MGDTYGHVNDRATQSWWLERARIIFAIEHEMGDDERGKPANKYWTTIDRKRFLQVMVTDEDHFRTKTNVAAVAVSADGEDASLSESDE
jgi:hypothetical protein